MDGKVVLITGASRGIGAAIAEKFAAAGASLVLTEVEDRMEQVVQFVERLKTRYACKVIAFELNLLLIENTEAVVRQVEEQFGKLDVLVNNAGINILVPALMTTPEQWDQVMNINLRGSFFMMQAAAKLMIQRKRGVIISIASQHGVVGNEQRAPYTASKAGLINLSRSLAFEWAKYGVRVNTVSPTYVITEDNQNVLEQPACSRRYLQKIPLRKYATPEDVAGAVFYLASDDAGMVTGHNLVVDGGYTAI